MEGKPAETVLKVSEIKPLVRPSPALRCVSAAPGVAGEVGRGASRRLTSIGCSDCERPELLSAAPAAASCPQLCPCDGSAPVSAHVPQPHAALDMHWNRCDVRRSRAECLENADHMLLSGVTDVCDSAGIQCRCPLGMFILQRRTDLFCDKYKLYLKSPCCLL